MYKILNLLEPPSAGSKGMFALGDDKKIIEEGTLLRKNQSANRELRSFAGCDEVSPVGQDRTPNAWGLFDMHGNVAEWCLDSYEEYTADKTADPLVINDTPEKLIRGGSAYAGYEFMRSAARYHIPFDIDYYPFVGMRLVLAPAVEIPMPMESMEPVSLLDVPVLAVEGDTLKVASIFGDHMIV